MRTEVTFLGYFCDSKKHHSSVLSNADNSFQYGYIESISKYYKLKKVSTNDFQKSRDSYVEDDVLYIGGLSKLRKFINLYKSLKNDKIVIYYNNLFLYNVVCFFLKKRRKLKYIPIIITDPYGIKNSNPIISLLNNIKKKISNKIISEADGIVTITNQMYPEHHNRLVINGGIDKNLLNQYKSKRVTKERLLMYTGNLYYRYNLDIVIDAINDLNSIDFKIFGDGVQKEEIISKQNNRIKYCGNIEKEELIEYQKKSMALIALLNPDELSKQTFPSKIFEYIASGSEVIVSDLNILDGNLKELCHVVKNIDKGSLKKVLVDIFDKNIKRNNDEKAYEILSKNYTWSSYSKKLKAMIDGVLYEKTI